MVRILPVIAALGLVAIPAANAPADTTHGYALFSPESAARLRGKATTAEAQAILKSARDGLAKTPNPIPVIHVEGTLPHQGLWDASIKALGEWTLMRNFALAYALSGDRAFLEAEDRFLSAWLGTYTPSFNPIDETNLDGFVLVNDLTGSDLPAPTREKLTTFLRGVSEGYLDRIAQQKAAGKEDRYNWQSHRIKILVLAAFATGDEKLMARAEEAFRRQVEVNVAADGEVLDFAKRDALHYVTYDLEPLVAAALAAQAHGKDWLHAASPGKASVASALDWLMPYALGDKTHDEFVHSSVSFDAERAKAGMKGYSGPWTPGSSTVLYQSAALLDPKYRPVLERLQTVGSKGLDWLGLLTPNR